MSDSKDIISISTEIPKGRTSITIRWYPESNGLTYRKLGGKRLALDCFWFSLVLEYYA